MQFLPFAVPDVGPEEIEEVVDSLRSGWLTTGPKTKRFESDFAAFIGDGVEAISVNSATAGLHLSLEAIGLAPGDQVLTTPYTFTATAEVIRYFNADPVFVDIDPDTFNIDPRRLDAKATPRAKALMPVHFGGLACDMDSILDFARNYQLRVVEDAAHSFPTYYKNRLIGTLDSDATVFSFYATKTLATGEGGMIITRDKDLAARCRIMRLHGISRDAFDRYTSKEPAWYYEVVAPGYKYNLTDVASSIGIHQLKKANRFAERRLAIAKRYDEGLRKFPVRLPPKAPAGSGSSHAYHLYVIRLERDHPIERNAFIDKMAGLGIGTSVHFIPLHLHPYWRDRYHLKPQDFPNATAAYERAVSLPIYTKMTDDDVDRVIAAVRSILT